MSLAGGVLAGAEVALLALRKARLQQLVEDGHWGAKAAMALRERSEQFVATVRIGTTLMLVVAAGYGVCILVPPVQTALVELAWTPGWARGLAHVMTIAVVAYLTLVLGELVPRSLALKWAQTYALLVAKPLLGLSWLTLPLVRVLSGSSNLLLRPFGDHTTFTEMRFSAEELQQLVHEATRSGAVDSRTGEMASRALEFGELLARDVMVPRNRIHAIPHDASPEEVTRLLIEEGHSRMPVYKGTLNNVIGYVGAKDVLAMLADQQLIVLDDLLRPAYFVPETVKAISVFHELQKRQMRLAIVVDEHGAVCGLITDEDLVEELVGELFSEHDAPELLVQQESEGVFLVKGHTTVREVNRALETTFDEDAQWTTVAGLCLAVAGQIPAKGAKLDAGGGVRLEVVDASPHLVRQVRIRLPRRTGVAPESDPPELAG
ncbi:MAG: HlyC/CorC family transporter [Candidatus Riflebacteria bacterium]|nr:HlyC/CorC family transporter [Candidatus Riflebacteria bacterium]